MDRILTKLGIGIGMFLMILEISYINAKSLLYLVSQETEIDKIFAIIGAAAFSTVTVIVMRNTSEKWPKIAFPLFDVGLVFCGFNIQQIDHLPIYTVAFWLTIFMALLAGLTMYSLGIINYNRHIIPATLQQGNINLQQLEIELQQKDRELQQVSSKMQQLEKQLQQNAADCSCKYCGGEFKSEASKRSHEGKCKEKPN